MKLIHSLNTPNHFNKPAYNNYYSGYSNNYQPDNHKCRQSFRDTNARNRLSYQLKKLKWTDGDNEFETDIKNNNLRARGLSFSDCIQNPDIPNDLCSIGEFWKCMEKECEPLPGAQIQDNYEMERDGCRQRQVNRRQGSQPNLCRPKNPECYPYLIEVIPSPIELPPIYGDWFPVPPEKDPECYECPDETDAKNSQLEQAIWDAQFGGNCDGEIITYSFVITGPAYKGYAYIGNDGEITNIEKGVEGEVDVAKANCKKNCKYTSLCGSANAIAVGGYPLGHNAIDYFYDVLSFTEFKTRDSATAKIVIGVQLCFISEQVEAVKPSGNLAYIVYNVDAILTAHFYQFKGSFNSPITKFPKGSCLNSFSVGKTCYDGQGNYYINNEAPVGGPPPKKPSFPKPKEKPPECMQACTCEQIEQLLAKQKEQIVECLGFEPCDEAQRNRELINRLANLLLEYEITAQRLGTGESANLFQYYVDCCEKDDVENLDKQLKELDKKIKELNEKLRNFDTILNKLYEIEYALENIGAGINTFLETVMECCQRIESRLDSLLRIEEILLRLPQDVALELASEFEVVLAKLNEILSKLGNEDGDIFSKILQIITLIATLLGLFNDIRALLERQKDYTQDLENIKDLIKELERLLKPTLQGSVDAIKCDGTIASNSWGGEGLEGLNQAITALGVNMAILHSDICELLGKKLEGVKPPLLQGSVDAIKCDGSITSNSWSGEGFEGLNQAITALGVNLAILHSDLCELLKNEKDTFQIVDKYKCGENEISVQEKIENTAISRELKFLYDRLKRIELLICDLEECNAVPVFPGDMIEERNIPAQAVITFVESRYYPFLKGSKWHINIPYPRENLIADKNCWQEFSNLTIAKGNVYGRLIWSAPNKTINRFWTAIYGNNEDSVRAFLTRIAEYSRLEVSGIRISKGANPRARPKNVTIQAVKVVIMERDDQGTMKITKCCRAPKR